MLRYILWRIAAMIPTLIIISALVFTIIELPPGDYFESYVSELRAQGEAVDMQEIEELRVQYGFDKPPVLRYFHWVAGMLQGDFGYSFEYQLPVSDVVGDRLWLTVMVSFSAKSVPIESVSAAPESAVPVPICAVATSLLFCTEPFLEPLT